MDKANIDGTAGGYVRDLFTVDHVSGGMNVAVVEH